MRHEEQFLCLQVLPYKEEGVPHHVLQIHVVLGDTEPHGVGGATVQGGVVPGQHPSGGDVGNVGVQEVVGLVGGSGGVRAAVPDLDLFM